jgi:hypothetical protein
MVGVPSGTPLYVLERSRAWRRVQAPPVDPSQFWAQLERLLGRKTNADEERFFTDFAMVGSTTGGSSGPATTVETAVSDPHGSALLAPQSLGGPTRAISATPQPLPEGQLPGGLNRSGTRLYRVVFDLLRGNGVDTAGRHAIYVYVTHSAKLGVWKVAWVASK